MEPRAPRFDRRRPPNDVPMGTQARHDPRAFGRGFNDGLNSDQFAPQGLRDRIGRQGVVPLGQAIDKLTADNLPPQLVQASFMVQITEFGVAGAKLLIPKNPRRWSYLVSNYEGVSLLMFSFDKPLTVASIVGAGAGIPVGGYYQESNGEVTINDIWVFCNDSAQTYPFWVLGYEGGISIAGNQR